MGASLQSLPSLAVSSGKDLHQTMVRYLNYLACLIFTVKYIPCPSVAVDQKRYKAKS